MKTNKEMAVELYKSYQAAVKEEKELWNRSRKHYADWEGSECENEGAWEEYEKTHDQYIEAQKKTNLIARLAIEYAFKENNA